MSLYDYNQSKDLAALDCSFASLIMAALRKADSLNAIRLKQTFPEICHELQERYNAPAGLLPGEEFHDGYGSYVVGKKLIEK